MKDTVTLTPKARSIAESRAREDGFPSVDAYVDALIEEDKEQALARDWLRQRIGEGLASPSAGEMTRDKLERLVSEGAARVAPKG
jgi:hypothetical protein